MLHGLYWLTANLAGQGPLLLAVDDLHWSDRPSLRFVAHLARRLEGLPVLLMATTRPTRSAASADALLPAVVAEPGVLVVRPAALGSTACSAVIRSGLAGDPSPGFEEACREVTGGNPFLLYALIDTVAAEGLRGGDGDVAHVRRLTPRRVPERPAPVGAHVVGGLVRGPCGGRARYGRHPGADRHPRGAPSAVRR